MEIKAVIFDIYGTLLEVRPAIALEEERWSRLWWKWLSREPSIEWTAFKNSLQELIDLEHKRVHAIGISNPEVNWHLLVQKLVPELVKAGQRDPKLFWIELAQVERDVRLMEGARDLLRVLINRGIRIGIASNCQFYTLLELERELGEPLASTILNGELCFYSFRFGFSKPEPHVFRILSIRLRSEGISEEDILMVGDRLDRDIRPAIAQGWQAWLFCDRVERCQEPVVGVGNFAALERWLQRCVLKL